MKTKTIHASGKRKTAIARATLRPGVGIIRLNSTSLDEVTPIITKEKIREPMVLANNPKVNIDIVTSGGGVIGLADAARTAVAKALVEHTPGLKKVFLDYDRTLLVADVRRKEVAKPNRHGQARAKRQKSYR